MNPEQLAELLASTEKTPAQLRPDKASAQTIQSPDKQGTRTTEQAEAELLLNAGKRVEIEALADPKKERFCREYSVSGNGSDAYRIAYSSRAKPQTCSQQGSKLLKNPQVAARIQALADARAVRLKAQGADILDLEGFIEICEREMRDLENPGPTRKSWADLLAKLRGFIGQAAGLDESNKAIDPAYQMDYHRRLDRKGLCLVCQARLDGGGDTSTPSAPADPEPLDYAEPPEIE